MGSASIFLKDPKVSRFLGGGIAEAESLLGSPLPRLPTPEQEGDRDVFYVNFHPRLRTLARKFILDLLGQIGIALPGSPSRGDSGRDQAEYEAALARVLRSARKRRPPPGAPEPLLARPHQGHRRVPERARVQGARRCAGPSTHCTRSSPPCSAGSTRTRARR